MTSRYAFVPYAPEWPDAFAREAALLRRLLGDSLVALHHVGSTAVPGLAAKPVIDILPLVRRIEEVDALAPAFEAAGYRARGEYGLPGRRYFTRDRAGRRTHNVHVYAAGDPEALRHLAFRDYLRVHPEIRDAYAAVKAEAFARHPDDIEGYMDAKDAFIRRIEREALAWRARTEAG